MAYSINANTRVRGARENCVAASADDTWGESFRRRIYTLKIETLPADCFMGLDYMYIGKLRGILVR